MDESLIEQAAELIAEFAEEREALMMNDEVSPDQFPDTEEEMARHYAERIFRLGELL